MVKIYELNEQGAETEEVPSAYACVLRETQPSREACRKRIEEGGFNRPLKEVLGSLTLSSDSSSTESDSDCTSYVSGLGRIFRVVPAASSRKVRVLMASEQPSERKVLFEARHYQTTITSAEAIESLRLGKTWSSTGNEDDLIVEPCRPGEVVCLLRPRGVTPEFTYMYSCLFEDLKIRMPLTRFECHVLRALNLAPTQLHPNGWAFVRAFEILCRGLDIEPKVAIFFAFYRTKSEGDGKWTYLTSHAPKRLLLPYTSSYKDFKVKFFRVRGSESYLEMLIDVTGTHHFPLYWQTDPFSVSGVHMDELHLEYKETIEYLRKFETMSCKDLLDREENEADLHSFLCKFFRMHSLSADIIMKLYLTCTFIFLLFHSDHGSSSELGEEGCGGPERR